MDLSGAWRAAVADEALRRVYPDVDFDDAGWEAVDVPGHWRHVPAFAASDGPVLHRRRFEAPRPANGRRSWLVLDGVFYQSDVWLDGSYVGDTEGYFAPHTFEVTDALRERGEHVLAVEVACAPQHDRRAKRNLTGAYQHSAHLDPSWNPGGIWRPVRLEETGPVRIASLRVLVGEATPDGALVQLRARLDAAAAGPVEVRTTLRGTDGTTVTASTEVRDLATGDNRIEWRLPVDAPALWWPRALGDPTLHDLTVEVVPSDDAEVSHRRTVRTGLRQVRLDDWKLSVNGEQLFLKGVCVGPIRADAACVTAADVEATLGLALDAGVDLVRVHAHVAPPLLYDDADAAGLLLWQDLPLQWGYARGVRRQAARQAAQAVSVLGHHPSIAVWCGHNEPVSLDVEPGEGAPSRVRYHVLQQLPTWNRTILDTSVKRSLERADGTRPVVAHSGVLPHVGGLGTDSHLYFGWYQGEHEDLALLAARFPRLVRFVSELGAGSVPEDAAFCEPERWPDLDWDRLRVEHGLEKDRFDEHVTPAAFDTFERWAAATRHYQAVVVRRQVEELRRLKYRPTGGCCVFQLAEARPAVGLGLTDHRRRPKPAYDALRAAFAPVIVVADQLPATVDPGDAVALDLHVVNDGRSPIDEACVTSTLSWDGGDDVRRWVGRVDADGVVRVGTVQFVVPDAPGLLRLELHLAGDGGAVEASNRYSSRISGGSRGDRA